MGTGVQAGLEIRAAQQDDAVAISELLTELGHPLEPALAITQIARFQALAPNYAVFVAVKDSAVIGLVSAFSTPVLHRALPVGRVSVIVVAGSHTGQGIGSALLRHAEDFLAELGCGRIEVTSASHRDAAHRFYRDRGYTQQGVKFTRDIPGQGT
jgi:GNAT superfamily N-acetyltransferase